MSIRLTAALLTVLLTTAASPGQTPLGTAFTYQGRLNQAGQPFNGPADLLFDLYDADAGGNLLGSQELNDVTVGGGLFTVQLNGSGEFGASAFNGDRRWLEISVNGMPLSPRQELTAAPNALFALNADRLDGLDSSAFLTGIPVPLTLSGTSDAYIIQGENASPINGVSGVFGLASDAANRGYGVMGQTNSGYGCGVFGYAPAATGVSYGGWFESASTEGQGLYGTATAGTGTTYGVIGGSFSTNGRGVAGYAAADTGSNYGVYGESRSTNGAGVYGWSPSASGSTAGGIFKSASTNGAGVFGHATAASGSADGGRFVSDSVSGFGVLGWASSAGAGGSKGGDFRSDSSNGIGVSGYAVNANGQTYGVYGQSNSNAGRGVMAWAAASSGLTYGVYAQCQSPSGRAVFGYSTPTGGSGDAVFGQSSGASGRGTVGYATAGSGVTYGMWGQADSANGRGVFGFAPAATGLTYGVIGQAGLNGWAVFALGDMGASGTKSFRIDHPLDPEKKYLLHYSTEAPEPLNAYSGNVVTDSAGYAKITLPDYFEEINKDPRYQLTVVDDGERVDFTMVKVVRKIKNGEFTIQTSHPAVEVSWRVEATRNDRWVRNYGAPVEVEKEGPESGKLQHPELYGQPPEKGMNYVAEGERSAPAHSEEQADEAEQSPAPLPEQDAPASDASGRAE